MLDELDTPELDDSDDDPVEAEAETEFELEPSSVEALSLFVVAVVPLVVPDAFVVVVEVVVAPRAASPANRPVAAAALAATQRVISPTRRRPASRSALLRGGMRFVVMRTRIDLAHVRALRVG